MNTAGRGRGRHEWLTVGASFGGASSRRRWPAAGTAAHGRGQRFVRLAVEVGSGLRRWRQAWPRHRPLAACGAGGTGGQWGGRSDEWVAGRGCSRYDGWTVERAGSWAGR